jgi:hypothetical protein
MLSSIEWFSAAAVANGKANGQSNGPCSSSGTSPGATSAQQQNGAHLHRPANRSRASHLTVAQLRAADKFTTLAFRQLTAVEDAAAEQYDTAASSSTSSEQVHMQHTCNGIASVRAARARTEPYVQRLLSSVPV